MDRRVTRICSRVQMLSCVVTRRFSSTPRHVKQKKREHIPSQLDQNIFRSTSRLNTLSNEGSCLLEFGRSGVRSTARLEHRRLFGEVDCRRGYGANCAYGKTVGAESVLRNVRVELKRLFTPSRSADLFRFPTSQRRPHKASTRRRMMSGHCRGSGS